MLKETFYSERIEFEASLSLETQRMPDPWSYRVVDNKLISPITNRPVEESISKKTAGDLADLKAFRKIQEWAAYGNETTMIWVSPPAGKDLSAKAVVSELSYDTNFQRNIFNRAFCFDWKPETFMSLAQTMELEGIYGSEDFRDHPFTLNTDQHQIVINLLRELEPKQIRMMETGEDIIAKEHLKLRLASGDQAPLGSFAPSCRLDTNAFNLLYKSAFKEYFDCPRCKGKIPSGHGVTTCPHCGAKKEDYESGCD